MTLAPSAAPMRCATSRRAVGQAAANPAGAGKWMPSPRRRGGACAPRPYVCRRGISLALLAVTRRDGFAPRLAARFFVDAVNNTKGIARPFPSLFEVDPIPVAVFVFARNVFGGDSFWFVCHGVCVGWWLGVDCFGERHVVLFAQGLSIALVGEATEDFGALESTHDNPMGAVVVEDRHLTADGFGFGAVCSHNADNISCALESVNRYFKKKSDFFGGWESGTYVGFYRDGGMA
jgi:hypothetical protein